MDFAGEKEKTANVHNLWLRQLNEEGGRSPKREPISRRRRRRRRRF